MPLPVEDDDLIDAAPHLGVSGSMAMRGLPWLAVLVVLVAIFFFTAYASAGKHDAPTPTGRPAPGDCFVLDTGMPVKALCTAKGAEQLKDVVARDALCPDGSEERFFGDKQEKYCVASI